jgi:phage FluMu protein Com
MSRETLADDGSWSAFQDVFRSCPMLIFFPCKACGATLQLADPVAGMKCKCPKCAEINDVPGGEEKEPAASRDGDGKQPTKGKGKKEKAKKGGGKMLLLIGGGGVGLLVFGFFACVCGSVATLFLGFPEYLPAFLGGQPSELRYMPAGATYIKHEHFAQARNTRISRGEGPEIDDSDTNSFGIPGSNIDCILNGISSSGFVTVVTTFSSVNQADIESKLKVKRANLVFEDEKVGSYTIRKPIGQTTASAFCVVGGKTVLYSPDFKVLKAVLERDKMPEFSPSMQAGLKKASFNRTLTEINTYGDIKDPNGKALPEWRIVETDLTNGIKTREIAEYRDKDAAADAKRKADIDILRLKGQAEKLGLAGEIQMTASISGTTVTIEKRISYKALTGNVTLK